MRAELSYRKLGDFSYADLRLRIARAGRTAFDAPLPRSKCGYCDSWPLGARGRSATSLLVRDLDGDREPEVIVDLYTGGAHCCFFSYVYRYRGGGYLRTRHFWGNAGYRLVDLDRDGRLELETGDERFPYVFTAYADSVDPLQVLQYRAGRFVDATRSFPREVERHADRLWRDYLRVRLEPDADVRGLLAAYVADLYLVGRGDEGWERLLSAWRRRDVSKPRGLLATGRAYLAKLRRFLAETGYIRGPLPALPPPDWTAAAIDLEMTVFKPARTFGLVLQRVEARPAGCPGPPPGDQLEALYYREGARRLRIAEGSPRYCADAGDVVLIGRPAIHGVRARLYEHCEGPGCPAPDSHLLLWRERGTEIAIVARGLSREELLELARGMAPVGVP